ncbi:MULTISPECIES: PA2169 family four-helix-bundle protein [unclassified Brevundimonas]|uniref:PA2169 family four-helix-bundle protein n=1 Tax=unclassified Brevundimonas TaxID=2622653 RepID=UPI0025BF99DB|nr:MULTISPECIES: PA2169 family four-helix-bundle protein [unclassified Brevundimonas]
MSSPNSHDIKVLNSLAEGLIDSADGYAEAAAETDDVRYRDLFVRRSDERRRIASDLQAAVRGMGGQPEDEGSILAKAQRAFMDIKHALMRDDSSVVGSIENSEAHLQARFDRAMDDQALSATTRETIRRAQAAVRTGHDEMHLLRRSLEGQHDADNPLYPQ